MQMIYNSPNYCVVEFKDAEGHAGGYEIMDKSSRRELFLGGILAETFRVNVAELIQGEPSIEEVEGLMQQPLTLH
jgi:Protein of unknown function (DUF3567)